jgi:hypothetical protein
MVVAAGIGLLAACEPATVTVRYRPAVGASYSYRSTVSSETVVTLGDDAPRRTTDEVAIGVRQSVLERVGEGVRVRVELSRAGSGVRRYVMRFDRAAQLTEVESVEGIPAEALGELGLAEIFPPAAGAPPPHPLAPGDSWPIDDEVSLPDMAAPAQLTGSGRLLSLGVEDGREIGTVASRFSLPIATSTPSSSGVRTITGVQTTAVVTTYHLDDGSVRRSTSRTTGQFSVVLSPPVGQDASPIDGTLLLDVRSRTVAGG